MRIELVGGKGYTEVDAADYPWLSRYRWYNVKGYARAVVRKEPKTWRYMHQLILGKPQVGEEIDHVNRNPLDNRRINLRLVNKYQQMQNCNWQHRNRSGFVGVFWDKQKGKWRAEIMRNRKRFMKRFESREDAERWWTEQADRLTAFACQV